MGKYSVPVVSVTDLGACLPALPLPIAWRVALYPRPKNTTTFLPCVELVLNCRNGSTWVYKRFGSPPKTQSTISIMAALLHAAQEASWFCEGRSVQELASLVEWEWGAVQFKT